MRVLIAAVLLLLPATAAGAPTVHSGYAVRHRSLAYVAAQRGMKTTGVLFASPLYPLGTRICVDSGRVKPICGIVVDVPQPEHKAWQLEERRYVEVSPAIAALLCNDPAGLPSQCPVDIWRNDGNGTRLRPDADHSRRESPYRPKVGRRMVRLSATHAGALP